MLDQPYEQRCEVLFSDIDVNGHAHHLAYLRYAEAARVRALAQYGITPTDLAAAERAVVVLHLEISFTASVSFSDVVHATASYEFGTGKSFRCAQHIRTESAGDAAVVNAVLGLMDTRAQRLVDDPLRALASMTGR